MRFAIKQNTPLTSCVYRMTLQGDTSAITAPGQFVQVQVPGFYLRRPISVCDWDSETLTLVYKVVGNGTDAMCRMIPGTELDLLTGLGNGFDITRCGERPLLIGGGVPLRIGAEPMCVAALADIARRAARIGERELGEVVRVLRGDERCQQGDADRQDDDGERDDRRPALAELGPEAGYGRGVLHRAPPFRSLGSSPT